MEKVNKIQFKYDTSSYLVLFVLVPCVKNEDLTVLKSHELRTPKTQQLN